MYLMVTNKFTRAVSSFQCEVSFEQFPDWRMVFINKTPLLKLKLRKKRFACMQVVCGTASASDSATTNNNRHNRMQNIRTKKTRAPLTGPFCRNRNQSFKKCPCQALSKLLLFILFLFILDRVQIRNPDADLESPNEVKQISSKQDFRSTKRREAPNV